MITTQSDTASVTFVSIQSMSNKRICSASPKHSNELRPVNKRRGFFQHLRQWFDLTSFDLEVSLKVTHQPLVAADERVAEETECVGRLVCYDVFHQTTNSRLICLLQLQTKNIVRIVWNS